MVAALAPLPNEREFRGPGCTDDCRVVAAIVPGIFGRSELLLHDPVQHEAFGMALGVTERYSTLDIATGPLLVRLATAEVYVNGVQSRVTPTEWEILRFLARKIGRLVTTQDILAAVWPDWTHGGRVMAFADAHLIRVNLARLRAKLGPDARHLIATRLGLGLVLLREPYTGPAL